MIAEPDAVDANRSEYLGPAWRRHSDLLEIGSPRPTQDPAAATEG